MQNNAGVNYHAIEEQRATEMQKSITERLAMAKDGGLGGNLRHMVLDALVGGHYQRAKEELDRFVDEKVDFPNFQHKANRIRKYCADLINAIEAKRNFQGMGGLPLARQQELYDRVMEHFNELKGHLQAIERIEREARLDDIRSTAWVLKATSYCVFIIAGLSFFLDVQSGLASSVTAVFESYVNDITQWLVKFLGW